MYKQVYPVQHAHNIGFVKGDRIGDVVSALNNLNHLCFTHETEQNSIIPLLDVNRLHLKVYGKQTCLNIYIHWNSFVPTNWKIGTLEGMIRRAYMIFF